MVRLQVARQTKGRHVHGADLARVHVEAWAQGLVEVPAGEVVALDFTDIDFASSSYLKGTIGRLLRAAMRSVDDAHPRNTLDSTGEALDIYPVLDSLTPDIAAELETLSMALQLPFVEVHGWRGGLPRALRIHGPLDQSLRETIGRLMSTPDATASKLVTDTLPNATAWNNRLADLYRFRLARRIKEGRQWVYNLLAPEVTFG
jgi:hypothetical protein